MDDDPKPKPKITSNDSTLMIDAFIRFTTAMLVEQLIRLPRERKLQIAAKLHELVWPETHGN